MVLATGLGEFAHAEPESVADGPLRYEVTLSPNADELGVVAHVPPGCSDQFSIGAERNSNRFVRNASVWANGKWQPISEKNERFIAQGCEDNGCRLSYRFRLAEAAKDLDDNERIMQRAGDLFGTPAEWLLTPEQWSHDLHYVLSVKTPTGISFVSGLPLVAGHDDEYEGRVEDLDNGPYSGFGHFDRDRVQLPGSTIDIAISGKSSVDRALIVRWVKRAAEAVAGFYGHYPVPHALIIVHTGGVGGIVFGEAMGHGGASVMVWAGRSSDAAEFDDDWTLTHEMCHLALPRVDRSKYAWLSEGQATYAEPLARAQKGQIPETEVWRPLADNLRKGEPGWFDHGLDHTHTWGRTYWGGALFFLVADLKIREVTHNQKSLQDALRGVVDAGGNLMHDWDVLKIMETGDQATGTTVLHDTYVRFANEPVEVDLDEIWRSLGVIDDGDNPVHFDEKAPRAFMRRSFLQPPAVQPPK